MSDDNSAEASAKIAEFGEDPWIVYLAFNAPHAPFHVPTAPITQTVTAGSSNLEKYKAAVEAMDREIGDVIDSIAPSVLADTTIIFIGDNGTPGNVSAAGNGRAKGSQYEGGVNVPLIIYGPHAAVAKRASLWFTRPTFSRPSPTSRTSRLRRKTPSACCRTCRTRAAARTPRVPTSTQNASRQTVPGRTPSMNGRFARISTS